MKDPSKDLYAAEVADLSKRLAQTILVKQGDQLLEDPGNVDLDVQNVLRDAGKGTPASTRRGGALTPSIRSELEHVPAGGRV